MFTISILAVALSCAAQPDAAWRWEPVRDADREILAEAKAALVLRSPSKAEALLRPVLIRDPACGPCRATLARALLLNNRADAAYPLLRDLLTDHPNRPSLQVETAWAAFADQKFEMAQRLALTAIAHQPTNPDALNVLMQTLLRTGDLNTADKMLQKVKKHHDPAHVACLQVTLLAEQQAIASASKALERCRTYDDDHLVGAAEHRLATMTGDPGTYLSDRSRRLAAASPARKVLEATQLHAAGRDQQAEKLLAPYVKRFPEDLYARGVLGVVRLALGKTAMAQADLEACLTGKTWIATATDGSLSGILTQSAEQQLFKNLQRFASTLALVYIDGGNVAKAVQVLDQGAQLYQETPELVEAQARLLFAKNQPKAGWRLLASGIQRYDTSTLLLDTATAFINKTPGAPAWLTARLATSQDWQVLHNLAVEQQHADHHLPCVEHATSALDVAKPDDREKTRRLLFSCAVEARDLMTVDALMDDAALVAARPTVVLRHAYFLSVEGRSAKALDAVLRLPQGGEVGQQRAAAAATYLVELGRLDEAKILLAGPEADAETLLFVGTSLIAADRQQEGRKMARRACRRPTPRMKADCRRFR